jgi:hypothetical protein
VPPLTARRLRFKRKPRVEVNAHASEIDPELARGMERIEGEAGSHTERENLPEEVEPGVTYRDVRVRWRAAARLKMSKRGGNLARARKASDEWKSGLPPAA